MRAVRRGDPLFDQPLRRVVLVVLHRLPPLGVTCHPQLATEAGRQVGLPAQEIAGLVAAFGHLLRLRLAQQVVAGVPLGLAGSGLKPAMLHEMDQAILREALKQARRLQQRLKLNYAL